MTTTSKYNRSEIMKAAWETYKSYEGLLPFANCLKAAWDITKSHARLLAPKTRPVVSGNIRLTVGETRYYCGNENSGMRIATIK